jgi:hypothetical protein
MCQKIVPMIAADMAAGNDVANQRPNTAIKTADGRLWAPTNLTPIEAACVGVRLGYRRGNEICDR